MTKLNGYNLVYMPSHDRAYSNGCVYEHILVAEKILNRKLHNGECVHHIDENRENNNVDNLMVFKTQADHARFHMTGECILANDGTYVSPKVIDDKNTTQKKVETINRELLKSYIRIYSFTYIGNMFNVTDNAVRKWCDKYGLPRRKIDIKKYTDEEWNKL